MNKPNLHGITIMNLSRADYDALPWPEGNNDGPIRWKTLKLEGHADISFFPAPSAEGANTSPASCWCKHPVNLHVTTSRIVGCQAGNGTEANPICGCRWVQDDLARNIKEVGK